MQPDARCLRAGLIAAALACSAHAAPTAITLDGRFDDWAGVAPVLDDSGDTSALDIRRIWLADDSDNLFISIEFDREIDLTENNSIWIYLDADGDAGTGLAGEGLGADVVWRCGSRSGTLYTPSVSGVEHADIGFIGLPTVTASRFEIAIDRHAMPNGATPLFGSSGLVKLLVRDQAGGDRAPNGLGVISYQMDDGPAVAPPAVTPLYRERYDDLRVMTYNVLSDGPFSGGREPRFGRQIAAIDPDVICFQEIYNASNTQIASLVGRWAAPGAAGQWFIARNSDCSIVTRYPILQTWNLDANIAALLDTTSDLGVALLVVSAHPPCCTNDSGREREIDRILQLLRNVRTDPAGQGVPAGTAFVVAGDLNLVGNSDQLAALLTGTIFNNATFGPDFNPDWDESPMTAALPLQTERRLGYTWRDEGSSFWPGILDYFIYTDSVVDRGRSFVLYTPNMSAASLSAYGLQAADSTVSDHLPVVNDLRLAGLAPGDFNRDGDVDLGDLGRVFACWNQPCGDITGDNTTDLADLGLLFLGWGQP